MMMYKIKKQKKGISLLMAFGISFVALTLAVFVLDGMLNSLLRGASITRSTQLYYAAEAGLEKSFYENNDAGGGINDSGILSSINNISVDWKVDGIANSYDGKLHEHETIEIEIDNSFSSIEFTDIPNSMTGNIVKWEVSNINGEKLIPNGNYITRSNNTIYSSSSGTNIPSTNTNSTISTFTGSSATLSLQSLTDFSGTDTLSYTISGSNLKLPYYTATATVEQDGFAHSFNVTVPQQHTIGAFSYVIFGN